MNASCVGRVGALAVFLGVGAAILTPCSVASAAPAPDTAPSRSAASDPTPGGHARTRPARTAKAPAVRPASERHGGDHEARPDVSTLRDVSERRSARLEARDERRQAARQRRPADSDSESGTAEPDLGLPQVHQPVTPGTATVSVGRSPSWNRTAAQAQRDPVPPGVVSLALTSALEIAVAVSASILNFAPPSPTTAPPRLKLNGHSLVPSSTEEVTALYGQWTYLPGAPSLVQGTQHFDIVDPRTKDTVGDFDALVSRGNGYNYTSLLVTANDGTGVGTAAGQVPPVGSLIATFRFGPVGWSYTDKPSPSGNVISLALVTPFGNIPLRSTFDGAKGIADHTVDDRPIRLTNGYSIAPADPLGETITATSGVLPLWTSVQGHQAFGIFDSTGTQVGTFDGVFTTTSDVLGTYTQAILVTGNDGGNVGTGAGQIPPVGSVFNAVYAGADNDYVLYSSLPSATGDIVTVEQVNSGTVQSSPRTFIDASEPRSAQPLSVSRGLTLVPVSPLQPIGINGLPPREVQYQGYQQFDVYDSTGSRIGSVDADVFTQHDLFGIRSRAVLVTNVTDGAAGTARGDVPPVGSMFNVMLLGDSGFGTVQSVLPTPSRDVRSFAFATPLGNIPVFHARKRVPDRIDVSFFDPFVEV